MIGHDVLVHPLTPSRGFRKLLNSNLNNFTFRRATSGGREADLMLRNREFFNPFRVVASARAVPGYRWETLNPRLLFFTPPGSSESLAACFEVQLACRPFRLGEVDVLAADSLHSRSSLGSERRSLDREWRRPSLLIVVASGTPIPSPSPSAAQTSSFAKATADSSAQGEGSLRFMFPLCRRRGRFEDGGLGIGRASCMWAPAYAHGGGGFPRLGLRP